MSSALAKLIDRRPCWVLGIPSALTDVAARLGPRGPDHMKPRGFDVAGSGNPQARWLVADATATATDPANSVLALVRPPALWQARR
jgi:hypothetical protein